MSCPATSGRDISARIIKTDYTSRDGELHPKGIKIKKFYKKTRCIYPVL